jgi:acetoin utilization protein AcuC
MGWLPAAQFREAPMATPSQVARFHDPAYVEALRRTEAAGAVTEADRIRHRIGADGNPVFAEIYRRPMTSAGGILLAAALTANGHSASATVFCPGGGTHHGRPDRASGFCYLNDPVLGILAWLDAGLSRIVYLDIDAHHGDGVQDAFHDDPRVLTISVHEANRWPRTGAAADRAGGHARNLPVPEGFNDTEMRTLLHGAILPLIEAARPQAIFLQCGADALEEDPLSRLSLSNNAHWGVVQALRRVAPRLLVTGGGGYNPYSVARCWTGVWAVLNGIPVPPRTTPAAEAVLRGLSYARAAGRNPPAHWFTTLRDAPREGMVRPAITDLIDQVLKEDA